MYNITYNGDEIENGLGFPVAMEIARLLSLSWEETYGVMDNGCMLVEYKNGNRIDFQGDMI